MNRCNKMYWVVSCRFNCSNFMVSSWYSNVMLNVYEQARTCKHTLVLHVVVNYISSRILVIQSKYGYGTHCRTQYKLYIALVCIRKENCWLDIGNSYASIIEIFLALYLMLIWKGIVIIPCSNLEVSSTF